MHQTPPFKLGPAWTPRIVKWTIIATLILTFFALTSNALFTHVFGIPSPQYFFSLTTWGIHHFFLWQFLSYLFIQPIHATGVSIGLIFHLFFNIYLLWAIGSAIVQSKGNKHFIGLYFGGGLFVGMIAYLSLLLLKSSLPFAGATFCIYILLIAWVFLFPEARLSLFLFLPIRAKWLVFGLIGVNLLLDFSNGNFFSFFVTASAMIYAYLYSILAWDILGPFHRLHAMDKKLIFMKRKIKNYLYRFANTTAQTSKIFDIKTSKPVFKDEEFMNRCLEKISKKGKSSLTLIERLRMRRISKKKR